MHQALYRKWRPSTFEQVVGQEHITSVLRYEMEHGTFSHAYLFCGSRGTGKTTCAKILAKAVNCEHPVNGSPCGKCASCRNIESGAATDVLEMDAASNNGVDNIRDIRDEVVYTPSELKYRVYIVDEVHMLSGSAFNALLKTLEEPPEHVIFILATTELQKLPATIISRCQRFDFRRISIPTISQRLLEIAKAEGFNLENDAARLIAKLSEGGMRDAISLLDLCSGSQKNITVSSVEDNAGITGRGTMIETVKSIISKNYDKLFDTVSEVISSSKDLMVFWQDLISVYRDLLVIKTANEASKYLDLTDAQAKELTELAKSLKKETLLYHSKLLENALYTMQRSGSSKRMIAEMALIRMCDEQLDSSNEALLSRVAKIEDRISFASFSDKGNYGETESKEKISEVSDSENTEIEAEKVEKTIKSEVEPSQKAQSNSKGKSSLKAIRCKMEVAEKLSHSDIPASSFLKCSNLYEAEDGSIVIKAKDNFVTDMLSKPKVKDEIRACLSACLKREIKENAVKIEKISEEDNQKYDILDELTED